MDSKNAKLLEKLITKKAYQRAILLSATKTVYFAFGLTSSDDVPARLIFDRKKKPKQLFTFLRSLDPNVGQGVWGVVAHNRTTKSLEFRLEKRPIMGMARRIKLIMKERKLAIKAVLLDAEGNAL